jgi:hypothetical protein
MAFLMAITFFLKNCFYFLLNISGIEGSIEHIMAGSKI